MDYFVNEVAALKAAAETGKQWNRTTWVVPVNDPARLFLKPFYVAVNDRFSYLPETNPAASPRTARFAAFALPPGEATLRVVWHWSELWADMVVKKFQSITEPAPDGWTPLSPWVGEWGPTRSLTGAELTQAARRLLYPIEVN